MTRDCSLNNGSQPSEAEKCMVKGTVIIERLVSNQEATEVEHIPVRGKVG